MKGGPKGKRVVNMANCFCCCCQADRRAQAERMARPSLRRLEADAREQIRYALLAQARPTAQENSRKPLIPKEK